MSPTKQTNESGTRDDTGGQTPEHDQDRWPIVFDFGRWNDRVAQIREAFHAFDAFEVLPGELSQGAGGTDLRPAVALAAAVGEYLQDVTGDTSAPWHGRLTPGGHLAVYRDALGRLWCLLYLDGERGVYLEPVRRGSVIAGELGVEPDSQWGRATP